MAEKIVGGLDRLICLKHLLVRLEIKLGRKERNPLSVNSIILVCREIIAEDEKAKKLVEQNLETFEEKNPELCKLFREILEEGI